MRASRNILAVAVVTVALCADRSFATATASQRPAADTFTRQIVRKLQNSFLRVVPAVDPFRVRVVTVAAPLRCFASIEAAQPPATLSPWLCRLPPPGC